MTARATLRTPDSLAAAGLITEGRIADVARVAERYAVAVTPAMADLGRADPEGPIARQFVPRPEEMIAALEDLADPIGDDAHSPMEGLIHRYPDRVLLKLTHSCAVYCRFCFRREVVGPGGGGTLAGTALEAAMAYIAARPEIWEVILSGGDPLILSPRRLAEVMAFLAAIPHVKIVRIHTRLPAVDPGAITVELVQALTCDGKAVYVALHANHADEFTPPARAACARIIDAGLVMLGQSVLLAGVNDSPEALGALMRAMVETRIKPYYLHHPDLAPGTAHFRVPIARGRALMRSLRGDLSGLCQPTYVLDIPGGHGKVPIGPNYVGAGGDDGGDVVEDPSGLTHVYHEPGGGI